MTTAVDAPFLAAGGEMGRTIAAYDWSGTPLGPVTGWSAPLRTAVGIMLESRHPMLIWWGEHLTLLYNDAFTPLLGDKHPGALGSPGHRAYAEIWPTIGPMLRTVLRRGEATWVDDQLLMMNRRGFVEETYWTYSFSPVRDSRGVVRGVFTATNDTTERVVSARRLDTLRALGNVSAVRAVSVEQALRRTLDILTGNLADLPFVAVYLDATDTRPVAAHGIVEPDRAALPDGAVALPLTGTGDEPPGVLVLGTSPNLPVDEAYRSFLDLVAGQVAGAISDARAYEAQRRRAEALAELDRAKTEFFTGVSHEFRTPLTLIMGPVAELRDRLDATADPRLREALDTVHRNGLRLRRMVDSLLEFSRVRDGHARCTFRPVDLAADTTDLAALFRSAVTAAGLTYVVDCAELGEPVFVDPGMWEQVVLNLLSNALKFTLTGGIGVELRRDGRHALLRVRDTGSGIPAEHLGRVFERFHRVAATKARSHEGSGIGLALVHQLVTLHGGEVTVQSGAGGTTFAVRMPLGRAHLPPNAVLDGAAETHDRAAAFLAEADLWVADAPIAPAPLPRSGQVLVADDNADMRTYLHRLLADEWAVELVADGAAALEAARERTPDLVVSDVMMPELNGLELAAALRADPRTSHVRVLLLSARAGTASSVEGLAAGADDYLVKPFVAAELRARVRAQVQLAQDGRAAAQRRLERSEAAFRLLAEQADDIIGRHDLDGTWRYVSPSIQRAAGHRPADLVGTHPLDLVHPHDHDTFSRALAAITEEHPHTTRTLRVRHADGRWLWLETRVRRVVDELSGEPELHSSSRDVTDRVLAEQELARFRTLVQTEGDFIAIAAADETGLYLYLNPAARRLVGIDDATPIGTVAMIDLVAPAERERFLTEVLPSVRTRDVWAGELDLADRTGRVIPTAQVMQGHRDPSGRLEFVSTVARDLREVRLAEEQRRTAAAEQAARKVSEAAAARLRAMVQGLAAIVAEGDWDAARRSLHLTFVSERAEEVLGYRPDDLLGDAATWIDMIHPEDRAAVVRQTARSIEDGRDGDLFYRAVAVDGRVVWLHQVLHVVPGADGRPARAQILAVDVTEQKRAERATEVLAESGRLVAADGSAQDRLAELARLVMRDFGDAAVVSLMDQDGRIRRTAVAVDDPQRQEALLALAPTTIPRGLAELLATGRPVHLPITDEMNRAVARDDADAAARIALGVHSVLTVPLMAYGRPVGVLGFVNYTPHRHYDGRDLELVEELGRRASQMVQAERQRVRDGHMQQVNADLASAATVPEAAQRLVERLREVLGATAASVYLVEPDRGLRQIHATGYDPKVLHRYRAIRLDDPVPIAQAARTGQPVWIRNREQWARDWPHLVPAAETGRHAAATLPLRAGGRVVGTIGLSFDTPCDFPLDEQEFIAALLAQAAPAFERAATADERRQIAETLQTSLLPAALPEIDRFALAARYRPGAHCTGAGGDWYEVLPLPRGRVALVVGDVVGQGAPAAAVMGQLRSALSGYLLEGHGPLTSLECLDVFAAHVPGATGSTVVCLVVDTGTGAVTWARAGHPPPLVVGPAGTRYLEGADGAVLGVRGRGRFVGGRAVLAPGESVVLYTDGLVERRDEVIDDGLERLARLARDAHLLGPHPLADALLDGLVVAGPADDVAIVVARLLPTPLFRTVPAMPAKLRALRAEVTAWAATAGLADAFVDDLQLALGEAAANAAEHAYRDQPPGSMEIELRLGAGGTVQVCVGDRGIWRPRPADRGFRGRGLDLIDELSTEMDVDRAAHGTVVRFVLTAPRPAAGPPAARTVAASPRTTTLGVVAEAGTVRLEVRGDLDLAGVRAVGDDLLAALAAARGPVVLDLGACTYLASAGVALLARAAAATGPRPQVVSVRGSVGRILELSGVAPLLDVRPGRRP